MMCWNENLSSKLIFCDCFRFGRKYHLPSRLPPGCYLLSTLDKDQVNIGEETSVSKGGFLFTSGQIF